MNILLKVETFKINGRALRQLRLHRKLTLRQVAEKAEISVSFLCDVEFGRRDCVGDTANRVLKAVRSSFRIPTGSQSVKKD